MVYKPLDEKTYQRYLKMVGWSLKKGSIDHKLYARLITNYIMIKISLCAQLK